MAIGLYINFPGLLYQDVSIPQMSEYLWNAPSHDENGQLLSRTVANGQKETSALGNGGDEIPLHTNFPQVRSQSTRNRRDENDPISSDMMGNGLQEISTSPTNYLSLPRPSTLGHDENVTPFSGTIGNEWDETSTLPTNSPQLRSQSISSSRDGSVTSFPGIGNEVEEIISPTNFSQLRPLSTTSRRYESDSLLSDTIINEREETSALRTNSPQLPHKSFINGNEEASFFGIVVDSKMRKWIYSRRLWCLVAIIIAISLGIPLGFALRIRDFSVPPPSGPTGSTVQLGALLVDIDPRLNTMTVDWFVIDVLACDSQPCPVYDIFVDSSMLVSGSRNSLKPTANNSIPKTPIFSIDTQPLKMGLGNSAFFTTEVSLFPGFSAKKTGTRSLQSYPFDRYLGGITIFSKNRNDTSDDLNNLVPISINGSVGIVAGFTTEVDTSEEYFVNGDYINLVIDICRGIEVKIYAVVIIIAIWLVTLVLLSATTSAIFLGHKIVKEVLLIPVATLFAFTSLRGTMPSAPQGFGAIMDYIGILPCLAILTFCAVLHLGIFLFRDPEKDRSDVEKMKLND